MRSVQPYDLKKYIYEENKIEFVLESIGIQHIKGNDKEFRGATPDYDGINNLSVRNNEFLSVSVYTSAKTINGDIFVLVDYVLGYTFAQALRYLHTILNLDFKNTKKVELDSEISRFLNIAKQYKTTHIRDENESAQKTYDDTFLKGMVRLPYADFFKEGILAFSQDKFGIRFDTETGRVVFPWTYSYDLEGEKYVGAMARTTVKNFDLLGIAKYMAIPVEFSKTRNLYGYVENYNEVQKSGIVVVVEGEKSVLKVDSYARISSILDNPQIIYGNAVAVGGHDISPEQMALLESMDVEIVIALDKDISEEFIIETGKQMFRSRKVSYIYDRDNILSEKDSPVDKGIEVFKQLMSERKTIQY